MNSSNAFLIGVVCTATTFSIRKLMIRKKNCKEQKEKNDRLNVVHLNLLRSIQKILKGTKDEYLINQYMSIMTYAYKRFKSNYDKINKDLSFIINQKIPIEEILSMLELYMAVIDVFRDFDKLRYDANLGANITIKF